MADAESKTDAKPKHHRRQVMQPPPFIGVTFPPSIKGHKIIKGKLTASSSSGGSRAERAEESAERRRRLAAKKRAKQMLKEIGGFGRFQLYVYLLTLYPNLVAGMVIIQTAFILGTPPHRCYIPKCDTTDADYNGNYNPDVLKAAIPFDNTMKQYEECHTYQFDPTSTADLNVSTPSCLGSVNNNTKVACKYYVYDYDALAFTAVTEFDLVCEKSKYASIAATIFMSGNLVASLTSGWIADKYGRRSVYYWTPTLATIASLVAAHSTNIWVYAVMGFFQSFTLYSLIGTTFTLGVESVGKDWTLVAGNGYPIAFVCGELLLAGIFYLTRNWREVLMIITLFNLSMMILPFLSPESIKWLLVHQREYDAVETLEMAAKWNKIKLRDAPLEDTDDASDDGDVKEQVGILDMVKNKILRRWIIVDMFSGFVIGLNYYALSLSVETLTTTMNFYTAFIIMALIEVPFVFALLVAMKYIGRKPLLIGSLMLGGACCLISLAIPIQYTTASLWLGVFAKGFASAASSLKWLYTAELYPTSTRSVGVGVMATAGSIGCLVAPSVASAKFYQNKGPLIICGALCILAGITSFDLPETKGRELPETIEDVVKLKTGKKST